MSEPQQMQKLELARYAREQLNQLHHDGVIDMEQLMPDDPGLTVTGPRQMIAQEGKIPMTKVWFKLANVKDVYVIVLAGAAGAMTTGSWSAGTAVSAGAGILQRCKRMTEPELEVFYALQRLTENHAYKEKVALEDLLAALPEDDGEKAKRRLLADMKDRGLLAEGAGMWHAVM